MVAETCAPFTVLPAVMNEYRVPELNVQNGVLNVLSFCLNILGKWRRTMFMLLLHFWRTFLSLIGCDQAHRQTTASVVKHIAMGGIGLGCEDALISAVNS